MRMELEARPLGEGCLCCCWVFLLGLPLPFSSFVLVWVGLLCSFVVYLTHHLSSEFQETRVGSRSRPLRNRDVLRQTPHQSIGSEIYLGKWENDKTKKEMVHLRWAGTGADSSHLKGMVCWDGRLRRLPFIVSASSGCRLRAELIS